MTAQGDSSRLFFFLLFSSPILSGRIGCLP